MIQEVLRIDIYRRFKKYKNINIWIYTYHIFFLLVLYQWCLYGDLYTPPDMY
jgi:hypothetical protein